MGKQHCVSGVLAGLGIVALIPSAPPLVRLLVVAVTGGAALLPDLDLPQSTAARSLGIVTKTIARGVDAASLAIYHATREGDDPAERHSGHRTVSHTSPGCLLAACLLAACCLLHPLAGALCVGLLVGLLGVMFDGLFTKAIRFVAGSLGKAVGGVVKLLAVSPGFTLFAGGTYLGWHLLTTEGGWWWLLPVTVFVGCFVHILGDTITNSGTPLLWPLMRGGRRWRLVTTPVTFAAGDEVEHLLVAPLLVLGVVAASGGVLGLWGVLWVAIAKGGT